MKKFLAILLALVMVLAMVACGADKAPATDAGNTDTGASTGAEQGASGGALAGGVEGIVYVYYKGRAPITESSASVASCTNGNFR